MNEIASRFEWQSVSTWQALIALGCLSTAGLVFARTIRRESRRETTGEPEGTVSVWQNRQQLARGISLGLSLAALVLLAAAVLDVRRERRQSTDPGTVVVVLDESASVRRDDELRRRQLDEFSGRLTAALQPDQGLAREEAEPVRLVRFSGSAVAAKVVPLSQLSARLFETGSGRGGTDIGEALDRAAESLDQGGRRGAIVLCSDGNQTAGDALAAARRLAERGIAVHVFPTESPGPALFLHGVSAATTVRADAKAIIRGLIRNSSSQDRQASVQFVYHHNRPGEATPIFKPSANPISSQFTAGSTSGLRELLSFRGRGLQCVEVKLTPTESNSDPRRVGSHCVSLPVYVQGRPRILVIGNDTLWTRMIDRDQWEVVTSLPADALAKLTAMATGYDAVVLSAVSAKRLDARLMKELRRQVESSGTGLLVINGNHEQAGEKDPSVLMSYVKTDLESVLPVNPGPRKHIDKPPARRVVITVDASGSMGDPAGNVRRIDVALGICEQIIDKLRAIDTLELIVFADGVEQPVPRTRMNQPGKELARQKVREIKIGGGTHPQKTLDTISQLGVTDGAFVLIGDGIMTTDYAHEVQTRVGSRVETVAYATGFHQIQGDNAMFHFDNHQAIPNMRSLPGVEFTPVEPRKREKFFERKSFLPGLRLRDDVDRARGWLPRKATLPGHAVSTLSGRPGTRMIGLHPDHSDPILVFGNAGRGRVGVFAAGIPESWYENIPPRPVKKQGETSNPKEQKSKSVATPSQKAVSAWLEEVSAFIAKDRYWMDVSLDRERIGMRLVAFKDEDTAARLSGAKITVPIDGQNSESFELRPDDRGVLCGSLSFQTPLSSRDVHLVIEEDGSRGEALTRPQRIPVRLPPEESESATGSEEDWTQGVNRPLLLQIAAAGNGRMLDGDEPWPELLTAPERQSVTRFWQPLSAAGALALVAAVFLSSVGRKW